MVASVFNSGDPKFQVKAGRLEKPGNIFQDVEQGVRHVLGFRFNNVCTYVWGHGLDC